MQCPHTIAVDVGNTGAVVAQCELDRDHAGLHQFTSLADTRQVLKWV